MKAIHGGTAQHDQLDAPTSAVWRRGGLLPQASVSPAAMRATRDLLRRRVQLTRQRAELRAPVQQTTSQDHLPELRKPLAYQANREGVAERCPEPAVQKRGDVARALIDADARLRSEVALPIVQTAKPHHAPPLYRPHSVPGLGTMLSLGRRYELHDLARFPRLQDVVSDGRLITWATASAGQREGASGAQSGHADRTWAFSDAAGLLLRHHPAGQQ